MGFRLALLAYADDLSRLDLREPTDDPDAADALVARFFPRTPYVHVGQVNLVDGGFPERGTLNVATLAGGTVVATRDAHLYNPTKLHSRYLRASAGPTLVLLTQRSVNDMFAYARWEDGDLVRSISVNPVGGVWEDIGPAEPFEQAFWRGDHPGHPSLPFHPLELSDAALRSVLGLAVEGPGGNFAQPEDVQLRAYARRSS